MEEREGEEEERRYHHILIRLPADADDPQLIHRLRDEVAGALSITGGGKDGSLPEVTAVTLKQKDDPEATQQYDCALSLIFRDAAAASTNVIVCAAAAQRNLIARKAVVGFARG